MFIQKALSKDASEIWKESTSGIYYSNHEFKEIILEKKNSGKKIFYLHLNGKPLENFDFKNESDVVFILGDHIGLSKEDEEFLEEIGAEQISLSPLELHADHCIILVHNVLDRLK
jgi:tRNA (pseudouridine54-N1)-methyltransferase